MYSLDTEDFKHGNNMPRRARLKKHFGCGKDKGGKRKIDYLHFESEIYSESPLGKKKGSETFTTC